MNADENRLDRLLEAARAACPPLPEPPPWLAQRVMALARNERSAVGDDRDSISLFPLLLGGAALMVLSLGLTFLQTQNPYSETIKLANSTLASAEPQ